MLTVSPVYGLPSDVEPTPGFSEEAKVALPINVTAVSPV
jgi:hypothetical protein